MRALDISIRFAAVVLGVFGALASLLVVLGTAFRGVHIEHMILHVTFLVFVLVLGVYLADLAWVAWRDYSSYVIRHVFGILALFGFSMVSARLPDLLAGFGHEIETLTYFVVLFAFYYSHRSLCRFTVAHSFPDWERSRSTKAVEPTGSATIRR